MQNQSSEEANAMQELWDAAINLLQSFDRPANQAFVQTADQAEADAQAGLFGVYLSAIDYDDEYYTLMDSIAAYRAHDFTYDGGVILIAKYQAYDLAVAVADDLHQVIMQKLPVSDFKKRHNLQLSGPATESIDYNQSIVNLTEFYGDSEFRVIPWCTQQSLDLKCLNLDEDQENENFEEDYETLWAVIEELMEKQDHDRLDQLRAALKIGKFAFVHPTPETQC
jgi:hypothetical protein